VLGLVLAGGARAADDCGPPAGGVVICDAAGEVGSYQDADGITYAIGNLTIRHPGDGTPTEFIVSGGVGAFGDLSIFSTGPIHQTAVSAGARAGLYAESSDGAIVIETGGAGSILTESDLAFGIFAANNSVDASHGVTVVAGAAIETQGLNATGIYAVSINGAVEVTAGDIVTRNLGATGILAISYYQNGQTTVNANGAIRVEGELAGGIAAQSQEGQVTVTAHAVTTLGLAGIGIAANSGDNAVEVDARGPIATAGQFANGIAVQGGTTARVRADAITTTGFLAAGLSANAQDRVEVIAAGPIAVSGELSDGIFALSANGPVEIEAAEVLASGLGGNGIFAQTAAGSGVTIEAGVVQGGGGTGAGVSFGSGAAGIASRLEVLTGGTVGALSDQAIVGRDGNETVTVAGRVVGGGYLASGDDLVSIGDGGQYRLRNHADSDGDGLRDTIGVALLDLGAGAADALEIEAGGQFALGIAAGDDVGRIEGAELLRNRGGITLADRDVGGAAADAGDRLWSDAPYQSDGGLLRLDAKLDAGGPGAQATDRLLLEGDVTGSTRVQVFNDLGQGAQTGAGNTAGISVVQVAGSAAADSFVLSKPVVAGAWQYDLVAFDPGSADAGEKDPLLGGGAFWDYRLQSSFYDGVYEYAAFAQGASLLAQAALGAALQRPAEPPAIAAPLDGGGQSAALGAGDLQQAVRPTAGDGVATGAWVAGFGEALTVSPGGAADFDQDSYGLQAGYDLLGWRGLLGQADRMVLGVMGTLAQGQVAFNGSATEMDLGLYGGGAYAAYASGGFQASLVAQGLGGSAQVSAPRPGVDTDLDLATAGVGARLPWRLGMGRAFVEPGAELRYVHSFMPDSFTDGSGVEIGLGDSDSLVARGRLRAGVSFASVAPYLAVGVAHEFLGDSEATASGLTFGSTTEGTALEVGGGITAWALAANLSLTLDVAWRFGDEVSGASVSGGVKLSW